jgi:hypothetical protein
VDKARTKNVAEAKAKAESATTAGRIATPNADDNSRHRKLPQPPTQTTQQITQAIATVGKTTLHPPPWPDSCINGLPHRPSHPQDPTPTYASNRPERPTIDSTAQRMANTTHNGVNCRTMLRDQQVYTKQHLQAKQPGDCTNPAGNDNVQYLRPRLH